MTGAGCGAVNAYFSGASDFTSGFHKGSCCPVFCVSLFHVIVLSFEIDYSFCLIPWYLYFLLYMDEISKEIGEVN